MTVIFMFNSLIHILNNCIEYETAVMKYYIELSIINGY